MIAYTRHGSRVTMADDSPLPAGFTLDDPNGTPEQSDNETPPSDPDEPPRGGPGSGVAAWRDHLDTHGLVVDPDATRDELIEAWDARG